MTRCLAAAVRCLANDEATRFDIDDEFRAAGEYSSGQIEIATSDNNVDTSKDGNLLLKAVWFRNEFPPQYRLKRIPDLQAKPPE